jgi:hypothetical protein
MSDTNRTAGMSILTHQNNNYAEKNPRVHIVDVGPAWMGLCGILKDSKTGASKTQSKQPKELEHW